jgi:hypothetical protein
MKLISFDVGIKNMSYCIFEIEQDNHINIIDWTILNLMDEERKEETPKCSHCSKKAKLKKTNEYFCMIHAKKSKFILPSKNNSISYIRKLNREDLVIFCQTHFIFIENETKPKILEKVILYLQTNILEPVVNIIKKKASETDLICIGKNMKLLLDKIPNIHFITHVIIENQISPIATRMKTIQGMLAQYFIIKGSSDICIEFVSSSNKLKGMIKKDIPETKNKTNSNYKQNKQNGILFCSQFLNSNNQFEKWNWTMKLPKKDDYADSFLQGIWYLKQHNIIQYDETVKHIVLLNK